MSGSSAISDHPSEHELLLIQSTGTESSPFLTDKHGM